MDTCRARIWTNNKRAIERIYSNNSISNRYLKLLLSEHLWLIDRNTENKEKFKQRVLSNFSSKKNFIDLESILKDFQNMLSTPPILGTWIFGSPCTRSMYRWTRASMLLTHATGYNKVVSRPYLTEYPDPDRVARARVSATETFPFYWKPETSIVRNGGLVSTVT